MRVATPLAWAAAAGLLLAAHQAWWSVGHSALTGATASDGSLQVLPLAGLAGLLLAAWLRGWGRRVVGGLVMVVLLGAAVLSVGVQPSAELPLGAGDGQQWQPTAWRWVALALALVGAAATGVSLLGRPAARSTTATDGGSADASRDTWRALDEGIDPTAADGAGGEAAGGTEWGDADERDGR